MTHDIHHRRALTRTGWAVLVLLLASVSSGASSPPGVGLLSTALQAQEPESVEDMDESPALQQLPQDESGTQGASSQGGEATADAPVPLHPEAERAIGRLRSPWCPGFMLEVCPSPQAAAFRDTLRMMAQQGVEADSLVEWALARHGEEWRAMPRAEGTGLLAWIIPPVILILGAAVVVVVLRRLRRDSEGYRTGEDVPEMSEDEERRIEEALRDLEWEGR